MKVESHLTDKDGERRSRSKPSSALRRGFARASALLKRLSEPEQHVTDPIVRQKCRFLATLLLVMVPAGLAIVLISGIASYSTTFIYDNDFYFFTGASLGWAYAYFAARKGRFRTSTIVSVSVAGVSIIGAAVFDQDGRLGELTFLIFPVLLASLILSLRETAVLAALGLSFSLLAPLINTAASFKEALVGPVTFQLVGFAIILLSNRSRDQLETLRKKEIASLEARYRTLLSEGYAGVGVIVDGRLVEVNDGFCEIFGYPPQDLIGREFNALLDPGYHDLLENKNGPIQGPVLKAIGIGRLDEKLYLEIIPTRQQYRDLPAVVVAVRDSSEQVRRQIELAELSDKLSGTNTLLLTLANVARDFIAINRPNDIFEALGEQLKMLDIQSAVMLFDEDQHFITMEYISIQSGIVRRAGEMLGIDTSALRLGREQWLPEMVAVLEEKQPVFVEHFQENIIPIFSFVPKALFLQVLKIAGITAETSAYYLPLIYQDNVLGSLCIWGQRVPESDLPIYTVFAGLLGNVFEKSRLYMQAQEEIYHRKKAQSALERSREEYRNLFESAHDAILILDPGSGRILNANDRACEVYGYDQDELQGMNLQVIGMTLPENLDSRSGYMAAQTQETVHYRSDGTRMDMEINYSVVEIDGREAIMCINRDVTERKQYERRLEHGALHDALTDLPNREMLREHLKQAIQRTRQNPSAGFAVIFLDLDQFKKINDSLGHLAGDEFLKIIARRLDAILSGGSLLSRLGGDEFVFLLESIDSPRAAMHFTENMLNALSEPVSLDKHMLVVTGSAGIVLSQQEYNSPEEYIRDADIALYRAKNAGKSRFELFDSTMHAEAVKILEMETELRRAIDREEFLLEYQPIIELKTGRATSYEALIRWQKANGELVPPLEFIRVAEGSNLIHDIGRWVLEQACRDFSGRVRREPAFNQVCLSINVSGLQLLNKSFLTMLKDVLDDTGMPAENLIFEVTETSLIRETRLVERILNKVRDLGVRVYLDDFGTGYSSLSFLLRFPIDAIKIDRQYILGLDQRENLGVIRSLVTLGSDLDLQVIAEGIETDDQLNRLLDIGCEYGQGYYFARPAPWPGVDPQS